MDAAKINSFASRAEQKDVQPEEPIFVLTSRELEKIITRATQPLQDHIDSLENRIAHLEAENVSLKATVASQEERADHLMLEMADDRRRMSKIENKPPGPTDEERIEQLKAYLIDIQNRGNKPVVSFTVARAHLELDRSQFSKLVSKLDVRDFTISKHPSNHKAKLIGLARKV